MTDLARPDLGMTPCDSMTHGTGSSGIQGNVRPSAPSFEKVVERLRIRFDEALVNRKQVGESFALLIRTKPPSPESGSDAPRVIDALIVPIDACYELVGRIRHTWSGIHGGDEVIREIDAFFGRIIEHTRSTAGV